MKIAISVSKRDDSNPHLEVFGKSSHYLIYNTEKSSEEILSNPYFIELGGAGIQSARFLIDQNIDILITEKIGLNPLRFLTSANVRIFQSKQVSISEILRLFNEEKLKELKITTSENRFLIS